MDPISYWMNGSYFLLNEWILFPTKGMDPISYSLDGSYFLLNG